MAISLSDLRRTTSATPPLILVYGPEKVGKTTFASECPETVFIQTEEGTGSLELNSFGKLESYPNVMDALYALLTEEHDYRTVVVDSVTALQPLVWAEVGERGDEKGNKKQRIEDFGFGKGYKYADLVWQEFIGLLNDLRKKRGMMVVLIAHSTVERFDDPQTVSYSKYDIDLHERARDILKRESDVILLINSDVSINTEDQGFGRSRAMAGGGRSVWMHAVQRPAYVAGNRYGIPEKILFEPGKGFEAIAPYLPARGAAPALTTTTETTAAAA